MEFGIRIFQTAVDGLLLCMEALSEQTSQNTVL